MMRHEAKSVHGACLRGNLHTLSSVTAAGTSSFEDNLFNSLPSDGYTFAVSFHQTGCVHIRCPNG